MFGLMQDRPLLISQLIEHAAAEPRRHRDRLAHASKAASTATPIATRTGASQAGRQGAARRWASSRATASPRWPGTATGTSSSTTASRAWARCCHTHQPAPVPRADRLHRQPRRGPATCSSTSPSCRWSRSCAPQFKTVQGFVVMTDRAHMPADVKLPEPVCLRGADRRRSRRLRLAGVRREHRCRRSATRRAPPAIPRACSTPTARPCCTRYGACTARRARPVARATPCCRSCRCSTSTPGACRTRRRWSAPSWCCPAPALDGASLYELLESEQVTFTAGVPTVWLTLLQLPARPNEAQAARPLKRVVIGGSAAPPRDDRDASSSEYGVEVLHAWGMTEMSPLGTVVPPARPSMLALLAGRAARRASSSRAAPLFGVEMKIVDDDGKRAAARRQGVRRPAGARPVGRRRATSRAKAATILRRRTAGSTPATSRRSIPTATCRSPTASKDVIKSGGEWISSIELENAAMAPSRPSPRPP